MSRWMGLLVAVGCWATGAVAAADPAQQRQWFEEARAALDAGHQKQFKQLRAKLAHYPLTPYLDIWQARQGLVNSNDWRVAEVLKRHADIPESFDLHLAWIESLAERGQWPHVAVQLKRLPAAAGRLPEIAMLTLWYNGASDEALKRFGDYWRKGRTFSRHISQLEKMWRQEGHPTTAETWQRIGVLARRGGWQEIQALAQQLPTEQQPLIDQWQQMQKTPLQALHRWQAGVIPRQVAQLMLTDALRRLSLKDAEQAWQQLTQLSQEFDLDALYALQRHIALRGARRHLAPAAAWLASLPDGQQTAQSRAWQVRLHLLQGEWNDALAVIRSMPEAQRSDSRWRYWHARCLAATGQQQQAERILADLAQGRGYHSFLAAELVGLPYKLQDDEPRLNRSRIERLTRVPGIRRAHEWWELQEPGKAGREWYAALADADRETWAAAAGLARQWGWYDRIIYSTYRAGANDALSYRFPMGYEETVSNVAEKNNLHASLIWSVIRQESAFNMQALSRTGARGLMQLMPETAHDLARGPTNLFDPADNIRLGSRYLARLTRRFDGNEAIAIAAYNAGPTRVSRWLERTPFARADVWVEAIPYAETRRYVQQVMAFMIVYDWRQAKEPVSLATRMQFAAGAEDESPVTVSEQGSG